MLQLKKRIDTLYNHQPHFITFSVILIIVFIVSFIIFTFLIAIIARSGPFCHIFEHILYYTSLITPFHINMRLILDDKTFIVQKYKSAI